MTKLQVLAAAFLLSAQLVASEDEPNFKMYYLGFDKWDNPETALGFNQTVEKTSDMGFKVSGNAQVLVDMDDSYAVKMELDAAKVGQNYSYSTTLFENQKTICEFLRTSYRNYFYDVAKDDATGKIPEYDKCPLPAGDYWIKDFEFDGEKYKQLLREGSFWSHLYLTKNGFPMSGLTWHWEIRLD
ncbi:uncharacterized protein LOC129756353 [Uranotaenia lowii]|uniref:uncharacterized protein LOC129756353 n=1 Tax=Uranotaenia lowii TaxID=190385 RepID=UPI00247A2BBC|nr:uncharacterized protein LOC129756353 [Uranotaenia lowii]